MNWKLVTGDDGEPEIIEKDERAVAIPRSLLADMAAEPGSGLREIRPGLWMESKISDVPPIG